MKTIMASRWAAFLALGLSLPALSLAEPPALKIPSLAEMRGDAVDSVNITLGPVALGFLRFATRFADNHDPDAAAAKDILRGLKKVQVHNYQFKSDHVYRQGLLDSLRSQLNAPGWHQMVEARDHQTNEDVDIYCALENDNTIGGLVILAAEPREFTLVNIAGTIDVNQIAALRRNFRHGGRELVQGGHEHGDRFAATGPAETETGPAEAHGP